jgi:NADPH:quinone reductase-like Zn-dependent oxidoreductase
MLPVTRRSQATMSHVKHLIESGRFKPVIDRRYSLDQIVDAHRYVDTGRKVGSVVIRVVNENPARHP